jgi:hypothetical protein
MSKIVELVRFNVALVSIAMAFLCILMTDKAKGQDAVKGVLDVKEDAIIRKLVYTKGLITSYKIIGNNGCTVLDVPQELEKIYRLKRVDSLRLLLDIVKGGRPEDALSAAAFAVALEENPQSAAFYARSPKDTFDEVQGSSEKTERIRLVNWLEKRVAELKKSK